MGMRQTGTVRRVFSVAVTVLLAAAILLELTFAVAMRLIGPGNLEPSPFGEEGGMPTESAFAWSVTLLVVTFSIAALRAWWPELRQQAAREMALWREMRVESRARRS